MAATIQISPTESDTLTLTVHLRGDVDTAAAIDLRHILIEVIMRQRPAQVLIDLRAKPHLFREVSDGSLIIKFTAGPWMAASDPVREPIFWSILSWSSVFSHAAAKFSHHTWWPPQF